MKKILLAITLSAAVLFGAEKTANNLEAAYQKEFAFLKAQKRELAKRLESMQVQNAQKVERAKADIDSLQHRMLQRTSTSEKLSERLLEAERNEQDVQDNSATLEGVIMQASSTLVPYGVNVDTNSEAYSEVLAKAFSDGAAALRTLSSVRKEAGSFFLNDGTKADGTIVRVGNIASYGISGENAGALAPAGNGLLKLWGQPASASATALSKGQAPEVLNIFIYESLNTAVDETKEKTPYDVIQSGGIIAWIIVGLGAFALLLVLLRIIFLNKANSNTGKITQEVVEKIKTDDTDAALGVCNANQGATARVLASTIRNIDRDREHLDDIIAESILHENGFLDRFGSTILVIAAVAPLLGLLGTVTGMISTFDVITEFGTGDPKLLSGGISEALVTTELGLIVAIPTLLVGNLLSGWAERIKDNMEQAALHVTNVYVSLRS